MPVSEDIPTPFLCTQSSTQAPHPGTGVVDPDAYGRARPVPTPPSPTRGIAPWDRLGITQYTEGDEINYQDFLLKRNWGVGVGGWGEPLCQQMKRILSNQIDSEKLTFKCPTVSCNLQITLGVQSHCKV